MREDTWHDHFEDYAKELMKGFNRSWLEDVICSIILSNAL